MKKWMITEGWNISPEAPLAERTFAELFQLRRQEQHKLDALCRKAPKKEADYALWIGRNAACIADLAKIQKEIRTRKTRAERAGVNVFAFDAKVLRMGGAVKRNLI